MTPNKPMTAEERWNRFQSQIYAFPDVINPTNLKEGFFSEIKEAVSAEREACARIADRHKEQSYNPDGQFEAKSIGIAIRARGA